MEKLVTIGPVSNNNWDSSARGKFKVKKFNIFFDLND